MTPEEMEQVLLGMEKKGLVSRVQLDGERLWSLTALGEAEGIFLDREQEP